MNTSIIDEGPRVGLKALSVGGFLWKTHCQQVSELRVSRDAHFLETTLQFKQSGSECERLVAQPEGRWKLGCARDHPQSGTFQGTSASDGSRARPRCSRRTISSASLFLEAILLSLHFFDNEASEYSARPVILSEPPGT